MAFSRKRARAILPDMVPERARKWDTRDDRTIDVLQPRYPDTALGRWLSRRSPDPYVRIHLDELGSAVWRVCDGKSTVAEISRALETAFGERIAPVSERLGQFLTQLHGNGLIRFKEPE